MHLPFPFLERGTKEKYIVEVPYFVCVGKKTLYCLFRQKEMKCHFCPMPLFCLLFLVDMTKMFLPFTFLKGVMGVDGIEEFSAHVTMFNRGV